MNCSIVPYKYQKLPNIDKTKKNQQSMKVNFNLKNAVKINLKNK